MRKKVLRAADVADFLRLLPPGSEVLIALGPDKFIPVSAITGLGFTVDRSSPAGPSFHRRRAPEEQTAELGAVLWINPADAPTLDDWAESVTARDVLDSDVVIDVLHGRAKD